VIESNTGIVQMLYILFVGSQQDGAGCQHTADAGRKIAQRSQCKGVFYNCIAMSDFSHSRSVSHAHCSRFVCMLRVASE